MAKKIVPLIVLAVCACTAYFFIWGTKRSPLRKPVIQIQHKRPESDSALRAIRYSLDTFFGNKEKHQGFSGSVLIARKGVPIYERCFGYCDYRNKNLMSDTNAFQLASVSKTFTAMLLCYT